MSTTTVRRMPSADWIAFGVAVVGMGLQYVVPIGVGIVVVAVLAPSVLREIGLLKDVDEWTRGIMHRAGFHGLLAVGGLIVMNYVLAALGWWEPSRHMGQPFADEALRKGLVWVFLVSYIIQYWGAREGVFRILLAVAVTGLVGLVSLVVSRAYPADWMAPAALGIVAHTLIMVGVALLVRHRPRVGAGVLVLLLCSLVIFGVSTMAPGEPAEARWGMIQVWMQAGLIFGITSLALFRESAADDL